MYLRKKDANKLLSGFLISACAELKDQSAFLLNLLLEDDWSFIIKSHAVVEAAVTQMLVDSLGETRLKDYIERLPLSDSQSGKLVIAKQLGLLNEKERKFIRWFSELRNVLVHKIENVNFNIQEHFQKLDKNQKKAWIETITSGTKDEQGIAEFRKLIEVAPKIAIQTTLFLVVSSCVLSSKQSKHKLELNELTEKTTRSILDEFLNGEI